MTSSIARCGSETSYRCASVAPHDATEIKTASSSFFIIGPFFRKRRAGPASARLEAPLAAAQEGVDVGFRERLRAVEAVDQRERDVEAEVRRGGRVLGGVACEETFGAGAPGLLVAEHRDVREKAPEVETGIAHAAILEAIEVEGALHTVKDAVEAEAPVDRRPTSRSRGARFDRTENAFQTAREIRTRIPVREAASHALARPAVSLSQEIVFRLLERNPATVKDREGLPDAFRAPPEERRVLPVGDVLREVHPGVEVVKDEPRLTREARDRAGDPDARRSELVVQPHGGVEVGRRAVRRCMEPPGHDVELVRARVVASEIEDVPQVAGVATRAVRDPGRPRGLEPRLALPEFQQLRGQAGVHPLGVSGLSESTIRVRQQ